MPSSPAALTGLDLRERATAALRRLVGRDGADFRDGQFEAIEALVSGRRRVLVVQRTGWGKSAVYFVATALRRAEGAGPTVIVSPLLALMRDQIAAAERAGIRAVTLNSTNADEWAAVTAALARGEVDVLLVSPERLNNPRFREEQLPGLAQSCGLLVVDEAHCISDWGHDFRPDYRRIRDLLTTLPDSTPVLATTATANARVVTDVVEQLGAGGRDVLTLRGPLARESLRLGVLPLAAPEQRLAWLIAHLGELPGSGIVYALTVSAAEDVAVALRDAGFEVAAYTGRTEPSERVRLEEALRDNRLKALVATSALGMGFDKPDLGFVLHLGAPSSPVAYYQQVGRAGRATERADVLLMPGPEDKDIWRYFASASMPRQEQADAVLRALAQSGRPLSTVALESIVDVRRTRLELLLKVLDVDGAVQRVQGGWAATGVPWTYDAERYERVSQARDREQQLMVDYERGDGCRMAFLQRCLDDDTARDCGRCDRCAGDWFASEIPEAAVLTARSRLERPGVVLEPRAQWPSGMDRLGVPLKGRIAPAVALSEGRAVARLSDLGWGQRLRQLLRSESPASAGSAAASADAAPPAADPAAFEQSPDLIASNHAAPSDRPAPPELLRAVVDVLRDWDWAERPAAIVAVPSRRRPQLVTSLAAGLGELGRLPYLGTLDLVDGGPVGEPGGNSAFRLANIWGRFAVGADLRARLEGVPGPVLLVDDVADSRWTLTVAGALLREAGAPAVLPLTLAVEG